MASLRSLARPPPAPPALLAPARRLKSTRSNANRKLKNPKPCTKLPVVNPKNMDLWKQARVVLREDLPKYGVKGDIISVNRTHARDLQLQGIASAIDTSYHGQPYFPTSHQTVREALHERVSALTREDMMAAVPEFAFFAALPKSDNVVRRGKYSGGMPSTTKMVRRLAQKVAADAAVEADRVSLGKRPAAEQDDDDDDVDFGFEREVPEPEGRPRAAV